MTIRHTLAEMNGAAGGKYCELRMPRRTSSRGSQTLLFQRRLGDLLIATLYCAGERVPYWDTTARVMWGFGISLALFAVGNFLILLPAHAFLVAGCVMFLVGAVIITGITWWQAQFQWDEHVKEYYSGKTGANLGMAGQVLDGGTSDVEKDAGGYGDEDAGLRTPLLPGSAGGRGGDAGGAFGAADYGPSPSFSGRGGPVSVAPGMGGSRAGAGAVGGSRAGPMPGQARPVKGDGWGCLPKRGSRQGRQQAGGGEDDGVPLPPVPQGQRKKGGGVGCWTERL